MTTPVVFISYTHDSDKHKAKTLELADRLRREGVDCRIDQYETFPPEGWPKWMVSQIDQANFVLMVCTETYKKRVTGSEKPGRGLGAIWEGQLITQAIYEGGGKNLKFVPVIFDDSNVEHIPIFLQSATRFNLKDEMGYEGLYRLLTQQPEVIKPPLGGLRVLGDSVAAIPTATCLINNKVCFVTTKHPVIIWRLPRGFLMLENLEKSASSSWATVAHYVDYAGNVSHGTHYHESYKWDARHGAIEAQFAKLRIPRGDWSYAWDPITFMVRVREGEVTVDNKGNVSRPVMLDEACVSIHPPGEIFLPIPPSSFRVLATTGDMRDLCAEVGALRFRPNPPLDEEVRRLRREARIEIARLFPETHAAFINLKEIIDQYPSLAGSEMWLAGRYSEWLQELEEAIQEAIGCILEQA